MIMGEDYYSAMDQDYYEESPEPLPVREAKESAIEKPLIPISEIGQTVTEGRAGGGTLLNTMQAAIWRGAGKIELALQAEGAEPFVGAEAYGKEVREDIRQLAKINEVEIHSVHTPTWVGNLSGYAGKQQGFSDEYRSMQLEEVKKAIDFSADVTGGSAIVVHTGEYERPMFDQAWNKGEFKQYEEEPEKALYPLIDKRTGHVITAIRRNLPITIPKWKTSGHEYVDSKGSHVNTGDYIDYDENKVSFKDRVPDYDPKNPNKIVMEQKSWQYFVEEAKKRNEELERQKGRALKQDEKITPEEALYCALQEGEQRFAEGWALQYMDRLDVEFKAVEQLKKLRTHYEQLEKNTPKEDLWKLALEDDTLARVSGGMIPREYKLPTEFIDKRMKEIQESIRSSQEMAAGQLQRAKEAEIAKENVVSSWKYATDKSLHSYAELGIYAMQRTDEGKKRGMVKEDIFIAPENLFPEMGYGSHPEELIQLVQNARKKMVNYLTEQYIEDPSGGVDQTTGKPRMIPNPYYRGISKEEAEKDAKKHIKATLDTQHLGMWFRYFTPKPGETEENRFKRFEKWYMEQVEKMEKEEIIGNIHIVDGFGRGHTHLPAGEGIMPVKSAIEYLKKKGWKGAMSSEGYGEPTRQLTQTWAHFGSPIYAIGTRLGAPLRSWTDVEHSYFSNMQSPYFVFGAYAPSNDWTLWSGIPLE